MARKICRIIEGRIYEKDLDKIEARELTRWILELLKKYNEEWYRAWIIFDKYVKKRETEKELSK